MSLYLIEKRVLFQHIPRTGGTWIMEVLRKVLEIHTNLYSWQRRPPWVSKKHTIPAHYYQRRPPADFTFIFVRHPLDWYRSIWRYLNVGERARVHTLQDEWSPMRPAALNWDDDFEAWVDKLIVNHPLFLTRLCELFCGPFEGECCGFIGRTETLEDDLFLLLRMLDIEVTEEKREEILSLGKIWGRTPSRMGVGEVEWTNELREKVNHNERFVIERFYGDGTLNRRLYAETTHLNDVDTVRRVKRTIWHRGKCPFNRNVVEEMLANGQ